MKNTTIRTGAKIGAMVGGIGWVLAGILPGFYFGGYGAISLLYKLTGGTVEPTLITRAFIIMGMAVGIATAGTVMIVVGGLLGTLAGWLVSTPKKAVEEKSIS